MLVSLSGPLSVNPLLHFLIPYPFQFYSILHKQDDSNNQCFHGVKTKRLLSGNMEILDEREMTLQSAVKS